MPDKHRPNRHKKPERIAYARAWQAKQRLDPKFKAKQKVFARKTNLKAKYGITLEQYDQMFNKQGGVCAICGRPPKIRRLAVDHDHKTGIVRGLLCFRCNYGLGFWKDDKQLLGAALTYLGDPLFGPPPDQGLTS